jgi:formylmethanofuran dehydrogenase subunit E
MSIQFIGEISGILMYGSNPLEDAEENEGYICDCCGEYVPIELGAGPVNGKNLCYYCYQKIPEE